MADYGFIKLKGLNCFGKLVNGELLYYITFQKRSALNKRKKAFSIKSGVTTIYSSNLLNIKNEGLELINYFVVDPKIQNYPYGWFLFEYDDETIDIAFAKALDYTINVAVKNLTKINDLYAYIDFYKMISIMQFANSDKLAGDSILLILTDNHESFNDVYQHSVKQVASVYDDENSQAVLEYKEKIKNVISNDVIGPRDRVFSSLELMQQVNQELERRKKANTIILQKYGLL